MNENYLTFEQFAIACTMANRLHWMRVNPEDNVLELFLDHHALSMFRACPAHFYLTMVEGRRSKGGQWSLEFGSMFHKIMEYYYTNFRKPDFAVSQAIKYGIELWNAGQFENWKESAGYKNVGGLEGFKWLIGLYFTRYQSENERLRIIATETYFGKAKEVPLQLEPTPHAAFRLFYSGKIDLLCDDGTNIGPMDHKTHADFRGKDPNAFYVIQDGMTGYVYSSQYMVRNVLKLDVMSRRTNSILMNHIQIKPAKDLSSQFSRIRMHKSDAQLEEFRVRQIATARDIMAMIYGTFQEPKITPYWDTSHCANWFHRDCIYQPVHRVDPANQLVVLNTDFSIKPIWDPENRDPEETYKNSLDYI